MSEWDLGFEVPSSRLLALQLSEWGGALVEDSFVVMQPENCLWSLELVAATYKARQFRPLTKKTVLGSGGVRTL